MNSDSELERRITRLEDQGEIERLKQRYTACCDAGYDAEGIASLFVPDGRWVCTPASHGGEAIGHDAMREFFPTLAASISWAQHFATGPNIVIDEDGERAVASFSLFCLLTSGEANVVIGTYRDTFVKVDGRWYFEELNATLTQAAPWTEGWARSPWGQPAAAS
jgi:uncharacterized protein (TIGR02246 family)